jgi:carbon storage regulator
MLVLTRKTNASIVIRDDIVVTVVEIRHDKVRLGIDAPKDVTVHRREVYERIEDSRGSRETRQGDAVFGSEGDLGPSSEKEKHYGLERISQSRQAND